MKLNLLLFAKFELLESQPITWLKNKDLNWNIIEKEKRESL